MKYNPSKAGQWACVAGDYCMFVSIVTGNCVSWLIVIPLWARGPQRLGWGAELTHTATGEW